MPFGMGWDPTTYKEMDGALRERVLKSAFLKHVPLRGADVSTCLIDDDTAFAKEYTEIRQGFIDLQKHMKMICKFNADGECTARDSNEVPYPSCCHDCAQNRGFIQYITMSDLDRLDALFADQKWFDEVIVPDVTAERRVSFLQRTGCAIPQDLRAPICLGCFCDKLEAEQTSDILQQISDLVDRWEDFELEITARQPKAHPYGLEYRDPHGHSQVSYRHVHAE